MRIDVAQHTCEQYTTGEACGHCVVCNADVNEAGNRRFAPEMRWSFGQLSSGNFALYNESGHTVLITSDWAEVLTAYTNRPPYVAPARPPRALVSTRGRGKISAQDKAANTAALLAKLKGGSSE